MDKVGLKRDLTENIIYLVLWATLLIAPVLGEYIQSTHEAKPYFDWQQIFDAGKVYMLYFTVFVIHNFFVAPILIYQHRLGRYIIALIALLTVSAAILTTMKPTMQRHIDKHLRKEAGPPPAYVEREPADEPWGDIPPRHHGPEHKHKGKPMLPLLFGLSEVFNTVIIFLILGLNLGVKLYFKNERDRKNLHLLKSQALEQQLEHLRYQLNPHFFMNTLNNIHALVDINPDRAKTTIVDLSHLMRYMLYEGSKATVPISSDITFMEDYIRLMQLRYDERVSITASFNTAHCPQAIPPMLFISFIENAFKHGVSYRQASFIDIKLEAKDLQLIFTCRNSIHHNEAHEQGGIGLTNVRQRLDLLYADNYTLDIQETADEYHVSLSIPLTNSE